MARRDVKTLERYFRWEHLPQRLQPISMLFGAAFARLVTEGDVDVAGLRHAVTVEANRLTVTDEDQLAEAKFDIVSARSFLARAATAASYGLDTSEAMYQAGHRLLCAKDCAVRAVL